MRKEFKIGEQTVPMETNLGTAILYKRLTGRDLFGDILRIKSSNDIREDDQAGLEERASALTNMVVISTEIAQSLAYVMAAQGETSDVQRLMRKMNENDYLGWLFKFGPMDFDAEVRREVLAFWQAQQNITSESKN